MKPRTLPRTLYDKIIDSHTVKTLDDDGHVLLYIDRHIINEYTSPQAFSGLRDQNREVWRPATTLAVVDHVNSTEPERVNFSPDESGANQMKYLAENCEKYGIELFDLLDKRQGIEHVVAPEQGLVLPGMVIAAGDSHTTTYGALGAFGFGIGTSEIEHLLATQTLVYKRLKTMRVSINGALGFGVTSKDLIMAVIQMIGSSGATGFVMEFTGSTISSLSVEARMTICNMAVEAGARGAYMAPDDKVFDYLQGKPRAPEGPLWAKAVEAWRELKSDNDAQFDMQVDLDASTIEPMVSWGISPDQSSGISGVVPSAEQLATYHEKTAIEKAQKYMDLSAGTRFADITITHAFIGSCTNSRIEDLRQVAEVLKGRHVAKGVRAILVPGSSLVRQQAEEEGLADIFTAAGFEWRQSGCSLCLAMNDDVLRPGERCASSTNRNFEGRQGAGARTHLMSPAMVAAAAVTGHLTDVRKLVRGE